MSSAPEARSPGAMAAFEAPLKARLRKNPDDADARLRLASLYAQIGRYPEAEALVEPVTHREGPDAVDALIVTGSIRQTVGDLDGAMEFLQRAVAMGPESADAYRALGNCLMATSQLREAVDALQQSVALDPTSGPTFYQLGLALHYADQGLAATDAFERAVNLAPDQMGAYLMLSQYLLQYARAEECILHLKAGMKHHPGSVPLLLGLAKAYAMAGQPAAAEKTYRKAIAYDPGASAPYGVWLQEVGRSEEAIAQFEAALRINPKQGFAYYELVQAGGIDANDPVRIGQMEEVAKDPRLPDLERVCLHYALGKLRDTRKEYAESMAHYDAANEGAWHIHKGGQEFDPEVLSRPNEEALRVWNPSAFAAVGDARSASEKPILIVGMIRSGTTLLEQMLSTHSMVGAAGELRFWIDEAERRGRGPLDPSEAVDLAERYLQQLDSVAPGCPRVTDKMPLNFPHLGLIHATFPGARILHMRRHPVDTCLSIYATYLGRGPHFVYRREHVAAYYRQYLAQMEYWRTVLPPDRFYELDYEDLVADPETNMRSVLEFLGLPWEEAVLHPEANAGAISTPSRWQARQPVNRASVERWRRVEPWLGVFADLIPDPK